MAKPRTPVEKSELRKHLDGYLMGMRQDRYSWWVHWRECADYGLPFRYRWLVTPNQWNKGSPRNGYILDSTGTLAVRNLASGMLSGITSPTRPWFRLRVRDFGQEGTPVARWLDECERRMRTVFQESNFYTSIGTMFLDLGVFGTAAMLIYEDYDDVVRFYNPCAGEYYLANSARLFVDTLGREFVLTVKQTVQQFGLENCSKTVQRLYNEKGSAWSKEVKIAHIIEPADNLVPSRGRGYRETYWEWGATDGDILRTKHFHEAPFIAPRWGMVSNDAYGTGWPMADALGDVKQLQQETKRKAQAIDKLVNPPMLADVQLKNQPASVLPGGITYVTNLANNDGMKPVYQIQPQIQHMMMDIQEIQGRIKSTFFNDLFLMISQLDTVRTATEIDARREEKLVMLGPVLERFQNEGLDPAITRVFNTMERARLLPDPPPEIQGMNIDIEYVSMLAEAQRAAASSGMERLMAQLGNIAGVNPGVLDNIDFNEFADEYADILHVPSKIIVPKAQVIQIQTERAKQQQRQEALVTAESLAKSAKTLSETQVGGASNALSGVMQ